MEEFMANFKFNKKSFITILLIFFISNANSGESLEMTNSKNSITTKEDAISFYKSKRVRVHLKNGQVDLIEFYSAKNFNKHDMEFIKFFPEVEAVFIQRKELTDDGLIYLKNFENITSLDFSDSSVNGEGIKFLLSFKKVNFFNVSDAPFTDKGLQFLSEMNFSEPLEVNLHNTKITDEGLKYLSKIKLTGALYLANTKITDEGLKYLANQKDLVQIDVRGTKVTKAGVKWLDKQLPNTGIEYGKFVPEKD